MLLRLCGFPPFHSDSIVVHFKAILDVKLDFPSPSWDNISSQAKDFIRQLLQRDCTARPRMPQLLKHEWLTAKTKHTAPLTKLSKRVLDSL